MKHGDLITVREPARGDSWSGKIIGISPVTVEFAGREEAFEWVGEGFLGCVDDSGVYYEFEAAQIVREAG